MPSARLLGKIIVDFSQFNLSNVAVGCLTKLGIRALTPIQEQFFAKVRDKKDLLLTSLAGEGKATAAMITAIEILLAKRAMPEAHDSRRPFKTPTVIFFASSRQHAEKLKKAFDALAFEYGFTAHLLYDAWKSARSKTLQVIQPEIVIGSPAVIYNSYKNLGNRIKEVPLLVFCSVEKILQGGMGDQCRDFCSLVQAERKIFLANESFATLRVFAQTMSPELEVLAAEPQGPSSVVCERFIIASAYRRRQLLPFMFTESWLDFRRTLVVTSHAQNLPKLKKLFEKSGLEVDLQYPKGAAYYKPVTQERFKPGKSTIFVTMDNAIELFNGVEIDSVVFFEFPTSAREYLNALKVIDVRPTLEVPKYGHVFSYVLPNDIGRVVKAGNIIHRCWRFANPFGMAVPLSSDLIETNASRAQVEEKCETAARALAKRLEETAKLAAEKVVAERKAKKAAIAAEMAELTKEGHAVESDEVSDKGQSNPLDQLFHSVELPAHEDLSNESQATSTNDAAEGALLQKRALPETRGTEDATEEDVAIERDTSTLENLKANEALEESLEDEAFDDEDKAYEEALTSGDDEDSEAGQESAEEQETAQDVESEEAGSTRRTLTIRSGYVPKPHIDNEITITEPLSSNTVELRAAQARERRAMRSSNEPLTHQTVNQKGRRHFNKKTPKSATHFPGFADEDSILGFMTSKPKKGKPSGKKALVHRSAKDGDEKRPVKQKRKSTTFVQKDVAVAEKPLQKPKKKTQHTPKAAKHFGPRQKPIQQVVSKAAMASSDFTPEALDELSEAMTGTIDAAGIASSPKQQKKNSTVRTPRLQRLKHLKKQRDNALEKSVAQSTSVSTEESVATSQSFEAEAKAEKTERIESTPPSALREKNEKKAFKTKRGFDPTRRQKKPRREKPVVDDDNFGNSIHYKPKASTGRTNYSLPASAWQSPDPFAYRPTTLSLPQTMPAQEAYGFQSVYGSVRQPDNKVGAYSGGGKPKSKNSQGFRSKKQKGFHRGKGGNKA